MQVMQDTGKRDSRNLVAHWLYTAGRYYDQYSMRLGPAPGPFAPLVGQPCTPLVATDICRSGTD
jgi:hypothetical protein